MLPISQSSVMETSIAHVRPIKSVCVILKYNTENYFGHTCAIGKIYRTQFLVNSSSVIPHASQMLRCFEAYAIASLITNDYVLPAIWEPETYQISHTFLYGV